MEKQLKTVVWLLALLISTNMFGMDEVNTQATTDFRVMTYNVRRKGKEAMQDRMWHNRLPLIKKLFTKIQPDIVGLQEPTAEQIEDFKKELPQFSIFGKSRGASWFGLGSDEYNPILYDKEKFVLLENDTFFINKPDSQLGWMPWHAQQTGWLSRICTWGKFKVKATGREFYLYNTHFDHMYREAQELCATSVVEHITRQPKVYLLLLPVILILNLIQSKKYLEALNMLKKLHNKKLVQRKHQPVGIMTN